MYQILKLAFLIPHKEKITNKKYLNLTSETNDFNLE